MPKARIFDTIPFSDSGETTQNSEPSVAVDPLDPTQIFVGAFSFSGLNPFFKSTTGGTAWFDDGALIHGDKSMAWKQDGSGAITTTLLPGRISTFFEPTGGSSFGAPINQFAPGNAVDQPWVRTGPSNHVYVGFNNFAGFGGSSSMLVSGNGGVNYTPFRLDRVGIPFFVPAPNGPFFALDSPATREAVNGGTVYAVFERWNSVVENDADGLRFNSQVIVERDDVSGANGFIALGPGGNGAQVAAPTAVFANTDQGTRLTLGHERTGGDLAIAVDPNNAQHVVVAFADAPGPNGAGILTLHLAESFLAGAAGSWLDKFVTPETRSNQPAVSISSTGAIGLLYDSFNPATNQLSQHIVTTTNDFVTSTNQTLATETNATPLSEGSPYLGDFFDLTSVGNTFYGIFSASNFDNGNSNTGVQFSSTNTLGESVTFGRNFTGNSGTSSFQLRDLNGNPVASSIDPYFFTYQLGDSFGKIFLHTNSGQDAYWLMDQNGTRVGSGANLPQTDPSWQVKALADFDNKGPNFSDLIWQNTNGTVATWELQSDSSGGTTRVGTGNNLGSPDPSWQVVKTAGDFDGNGVADVLFQNQNGQLAIWELQNPPNGTGPIAFPNNQNQFNIAQNPGPTWHAFAAGDFNGSGTDGILFFNDNRVNYAIWDMQPGGPAIGQNGIFTFNEQVNLPSQDPSWSLAGVGDFNGAGKDDILWRNTNGAVAIWEMTGTADGRSVAIKANGQFNITQTVDPSWKVAAVRDFNNDGKAGILWQNDNGAIALWENFTEGPLFSGQATFTVQQNINPQPNPPGVVDWRIV